jgi:hypothetical protein
MLLTGRTDQYFGVLLPAATVTSECGRSQLTFRGFISSLPRCVLKFRLPHQKACAVTRLYITLHHYHLRCIYQCFGDNLFPFSRGKIVGTWHITYQSTRCRARKQTSHSPDKGHVFEMHTALVFLPFVLRLLLL